LQTINLLNLTQIMTDNLELEKTLWQAADKLHSNMDAAEYKNVVLGLKFLKYISEVRKNKYIHTLGRYIDFKEVAEDGIAFDDHNLAKIGYAL